MLKKQEMTIMGQPDRAASKPQGPERAASRRQLCDITGQIHNYQEFVCGWGAACLNIGFTFPMNKAMFRQQLHGITAYEAVKQINHEGVRNLYRGFLSPLAQKTTSLSLMFGSFAQFERALDANFPMLNRVGLQVTAAVLAGLVEATLTPFERVQTLMQDRKHYSRFNNTIHALRELRPYGVTEYYRALLPICFRNSISNALFFTLRGPLKESIPVPNSSSGEIVSNFISGAVLGACIGVVFFPVNVVKTRMQSVIGGTHVTFYKTFKIVFTERNRSWKKMFLGVHINYSRSLISWGIINASYELLKKHLFYPKS